MVETWRIAIVHITWQFYRMYSKNGTRTTQKEGCSPIASWPPAGSLNLPDWCLWGMGWKRLGRGTAWYPTDLWCLQHRVYILWQAPISSFLWEVRLHSKGHSPREAETWILHDVHPSGNVFCAIWRDQEERGYKNILAHVGENSRSVLTTPKSFCWEVTI